MSCKANIPSEGKLHHFPCLVDCWQRDSVPCSSTDKKSCSESFWMLLLAVRPLDLGAGEQDYICLSCVVVDKTHTNTHIIIIIIIIRFASCLVLSTLAWVRTCQTISQELRNCKSVLGLQLGYTRLPVWTLIEA